MVFENEADVLCEGCGKFLDRRKVISPSEKRQVRVVFDLCEDCEQDQLVAQREYGEDDPSAYAVARVLIEHGVPETPLLRDFMELEDYIFRHMMQDQKTFDIDRLDEHDREALRSLKRLRERVKEISQSYTKILETYSSNVCNHRINRLIEHKHIMKKLRDRKLAKLKREWLREKM